MPTKTVVMKSNVAAKHWKKKSDRIHSKPLVWCNKWWLKTLFDKSLITKLYYNINISNMSNFFLHCALRRHYALCATWLKIIENWGQKFYNLYLFIGGWNCSHLNMFFSKEKKKSRQPNTSSLNFQYNVPKHVRNIYHVHDLFQWGACLSRNNIQKVSKAFC